MNTTHPPTCDTCRHFGNDWGYWCRHPKLVSFDPVHGATPVCPEGERQAWGRCGPEGRFHEQYSKGQRYAWIYKCNPNAAWIILAICVVVLGVLQCLRP